MFRKGLLAGVVLVAAVLAAAYWAARPGGLADRLFDTPLASTRGFEPWPLPMQHVDRLFDIGIVDADGDGRLDIYTSNHHFRQQLLLADGRGGYRDVLGEWGLDQSRRFPNAELSFAAPRPDQPGVYVYWRGTNVVVRAHGLPKSAAWRGSMHVLDPVEIVSQENVRAERQEAKREGYTESTVAFEAAGDGTLVLRPGGQGLPLDFRFAGELQPDRIFVGLGKVSPGGMEFSLAMRDRHALAWADFNADGVMDVFINRGALSGTLRAYPPEIQRAINDELLLSTGPGRYRDATAEAGIDKRGCSGRHAMWVDFDGDGLLDLFVNCHDRENVAGDFPKQLYRQHPRDVLKDVAAEVALALPDQQMANLAWLDVDGDGATDLLAFQDVGLVLYRQQAGRFVREVVAPRQPDPAQAIGRITEASGFFDGKLVVTDFDLDGRLDVFSPSRRGNLLLKNRGGRLEPVEPASLGLPAASMSAGWVDFDNDGRPDLHLVPQGLYRQTADGRFESTGLLAAPAQKYVAAIVSWVDLDDDGRLDALFALDENRTFHRWWQFDRPPRQRGRWPVLALRNAVPDAGHWIAVDVTGGEGNRQAIGATVTVTAGGSTRVAMVGQADGAFFSQGQYRLHFGLGDATRVDELRIRWPDGATRVLTGIRADQRLVIGRQ